MGVNIPDTDVRVWWKPWKDVKVTETTPFETEFEQLSYTINFWCDLYYIKTNEIITNIKVTAETY